MTPSTPPVADPPERLAHLLAAAPVAHSHQEIDDEALEEGRRKGMHPVNDLPRELGIEQLEARSDRFLRAFARRRLSGRLLGFLLGPPGDELGVALEHADVDVVQIFAQQFSAAFGYAAMASPRQFDQSRSRQVGARPVQAVGQDGLVAAGQHSGAFLGGDPQRRDEFVLERADADLLVSLPQQMQDRQHKLRKAGQPRLGLRFPLPAYIRKTPKWVCCNGALSVEEKASERTRRVSWGVIIPSSQRRAVA